MFQETSIRLTIFLCVLCVMIGWEVISPYRQRLYSRAFRWTHNTLLLLLSTFLVRLIFPLAAVGAALWAENRQWGFLHIVELGGAFSAIVAIVFLDFCVWGQHLIMHRFSWLWRLHRVHHADRDFDVTTALRFHPVEIVLSMALKVILVAILGAPVIAVIIFEVLLNAGALFSHSNILLPTPVDRYLRWVIVTPNMHRIHHSSIRRETDSNYGFFLSIWDRLFKTYTENPRLGHENIDIGIENFREKQDQTIWRLLIMPFVR